MELQIRDKLEERVRGLQTELKKVHGELALITPEMSINRLQRLGFSPQMSHMVDYIMRHGPANMWRILDHLQYPEDHPWTTNIDSFYGTISRIRSRLRRFDIEMQLVAKGYQFDELNKLKLETLIKEAPDD